VLAIGGLKEKLLAAHRGGIDTVLIPKDNVKDLKEIPENIKEGLDIIPVQWITEVLEKALQKMPIAKNNEDESIISKDKSSYPDAGSPHH
jgi:ATP-dependent Lon protease